MVQGHKVWLKEQQGTEHKWHKHTPVLAHLHGHLPRAFPVLQAACTALLLCLCSSLTLSTQQETFPAAGGADLAGVAGVVCVIHGVYTTTPSSFKPQPNLHCWAGMSLWQLPATLLSCWLPWAELLLSHMDIQEGFTKPGPKFRSHYLKVVCEMIHHDDSSSMWNGVTWGMMQTRIDKVQGSCSFWSLLNLDGAPQKGGVLPVSCDEPAVEHNSPASNTSACPNTPQTPTAS